jgi:transglutaminase-like putative cysteine protease
MRIEIGCRLGYKMQNDTPVIAMLNVHYSRFGSLERPDYLVTSPAVPIATYRDSFGNWCSRMVAPAGDFVISTHGIIADSGDPDPYQPDAIQHPVQDLPSETLVYLLGSRYCETDRLSEMAWDMFDRGPTGWNRVQAICDYVHDHVSFDYMKADVMQTAVQTWERRTGVCRDFTHLAVALCRAMNIPTRYCTGYVSDIGVPPPYGPMDFAAWMEVYLSGQWWTFDPRNNARRRGRILMASGRDATDVPLTQTFGPNILTEFEVLTQQI